MRVQVTGEAAELILASGGQVWVWAARPRMCCAGAPAWMHAAMAPPDGVVGFRRIQEATGPAGLTIHVRSAGGLLPDVLEIAIEGRRRPKLAAYWDGCLMAMTG